MSKLGVLLISFGLFLLFGLTNAAASALAQSNPRFIPLGSGAIGALYVPDLGPPPHVAFLVSHRNSSYVTHTSTTELSRRGFMVLGMNVRFGNNEALVDWQDIALDVRAGVRFLRSQPGITTVILIGPSGGGPVMSFYQAVAENGPGYCQGPNKIVECSSQRLAGFVPSDRADGIVYLDAHPGVSVNQLRSLNAAVMNENRPFQSINPRLDPFSEKNGFNPTGDSVYSDAFQDRYFQAQSHRMNALIDKALEVKRQMAEGKYQPADEGTFVFYRSSARLATLSTGVHRGTLQPAKLLKNDGTVVTQVVNSVRIADPDSREDDQLMGSGNSAGVSELRITSFLTANAIRSTHSMDGIDWCSSNDTTICAIREIHVPVLIAAMGAHYFIRDNEILFENGAMADKDFIVVEGATHGGTGCTECTAVTGLTIRTRVKTFTITLLSGRRTGFSFARSPGALLFCS
jgi:hypothetical protein